MGFLAVEALKNLHKTSWAIRATAFVLILRVLFCSWAGLLHTVDRGWRTVYWVQAMLGFISAVYLIALLAGYVKVRDYAKLVEWLTPSLFLASTFPAMLHVIEHKFLKQSVSQSVNHLREQERWKDGS